MSKLLSTSRSLLGKIRDVLDPDRLDAELDRMEE